MVLVQDQLRRLSRVLMSNNLIILFSMGVREVTSRIEKGKHCLLLWWVSKRANPADHVS